MAAWDLVTKTQCAAISGLAESLYADDWYNSVLFRIEERLSTEHVAATDLDEYYDGDNTAIIVPRTWPIQTVTTLDVGGTAYSDTSYRVYDSYIETIQVPRTNLDQAVYGGSGVFVAGKQNIHLVYNAGFAVDDRRLIGIKDALAQAINIYAMQAARHGSGAAIPYRASASLMGDPEVESDVAGLHRAIIDVIRTLVPGRIKIR
jgi:hypothetical protein